MQCFCNGVWLFGCTRVSSFQGKWSSRTPRHACITFVHDECLFSCCAVLPPSDVCAPFSKNTPISTDLQQKVYTRSGRSWPPSLLFTPYQFASHLSYSFLILLPTYSLLILSSSTPCDELLPSDFPCTQARARAPRACGSRASRRGCSRTRCAPRGGPRRTTPPRAPPPGSSRRASLIPLAEAACAPQSCVREGLPPHGCGVDCSGGCHRPAVAPQCLLCRE